MVNRTIILVVVVVAVLAVSAGYYISTLSSPTGTETIDLAVTDGTPQNGGPDTLVPTNFTVTQNTPVVIVFDNTDDGPHEVVVPAEGFSTGIVQGGTTERIDFTFTKAGTYAYDQPAGSCEDLQNPAVSCTGPQLFNGFVIVVPP